MKYYCYLVICNDGTLYCGYTNDLNKRIATHNKGKGAKYTKTRIPVTLGYSEEFDDKSAAMKREWQIKQLDRKEKLQLIKTYAN